MTPESPKQVKLQPGLLAALLALIVLTGALAYGVYSGCSVCGAGIAALWGLLILVVLPVGWGLSRSLKEDQTVASCQSVCDHEYAREDYEEFLGRHGDTPVWCNVRAKRCRKCAHVESKDFQEVG